MGYIGDYTLEFRPYHLVFFDGTKVQKNPQTTKESEDFNTFLTLVNFSFVVGVRRLGCKSLFLLRCVLFLLDRDIEVLAQGFVVTPCATLRA